jgi:hypothetical protein
VVWAALIVVELIAELTVELAVDEAIVVAGLVVDRAAMVGANGLVEGVVARPEVAGLTEVVSPHPANVRPSRLITTIELNLKYFILSPLAANSK